MKDKSELVVSGITEAPQWAMQDVPVTITIIITDVNNERYQSDIDMDHGINEEGFSKAVAASLKMCDATPKIVHVEKIIKRATGFERKN